MPENRGSKKAVVEAIKHEIKVFNWIILLIVSVLLFIIIRFLSIILNYIPIPSIAVILSIVIMLVLVGLYVTNITSRKAIKAIDNYSTKLNTLLTTTRDIREIVYGDILLEDIMDSSLEITGAAAGSILLIEGDKLVYKVVRGGEASRLLGISIPKSYGITGWVIDNGESIRIDEVKKDNRFNPEVDNITGYHTRSILCVPLKSRSGIIGVLELINKKDGTFSNEDEELISYFADQAATSISRAKFYEDQKNFEVHLTENILLNTIDSLIPEKRGHSKRIAEYSLLMAGAIGMSEDDKKRLYRASLLHDIGFLKMRLESVISKDDYKAHCQLAYEMLLPINFYADIAPIVLHHHERYDGKGYPSGLKGDAIPLESRMIAIAEAFDAMASKNSYKCIGKIIGEDESSSTQGFHSAIEELNQNAGTQFDPQLVDFFVNNIDESSLE